MLFRHRSLVGIGHLAAFAMIWAGPLFAAKPEPKTPAEPAGGSVEAKRLSWHFGLEKDVDLAAGAKIESVGPTNQLFVGLPDTNAALVLNGKGARIRVSDSGENSPLDFANGDAITLEAWVRPDKLGNEANVYIVGKGRTYESKTIENQNYALRLRGVSGEARVSFLFATQPEEGSAPTYHRWTSDRGFVPDGQWHHVAVRYRFGDPASVACVIDSEKSKGKWDMAGSTRASPIIDNDALWIGSSRGGDAGNSFAGALDDVIIHRELVAIEELQARRQPIVKPPEFPNSIDAGRVSVTLAQGLSSYSAWPSVAPPVEYRFTLGQLAIHRLPLRYIAGGLRHPWRGPLLLRAYCVTRLPEGDIEFLVRSPGLARLWVDGQPILSTPAHKLYPNAHQPFEVYEADHPWLRVPRTGDHEKRQIVSLHGGQHEIVLEQIVGEKGIRCETGDTTVAVRRPQGNSSAANAELFTLLGPTPFEVPLSEEGWQRYHSQLESELAQLDRQLLRDASNAERDFWDKRHAIARQTIAQKPDVVAPESMPGRTENNSIDRFINSSPIDMPDQLASDSVFLRRIYLDTVGVLPSAAEARAFLSDAQPNKRAIIIDRLLADDRWADHWTSYWQDVLAENPSILKPTLNNTGPFRWWIHDALLENKAMDRFVTELIRMEGDSQGGGAAGFKMASENDVPMAAKAHILASAFLGVEMKCARCHDAPYHPWTQRELFSMAAMLENKPLKIPKTSSVPKEFFERKKGDSTIHISIFPGDEIAPSWPFKDLTGDQPEDVLLGREKSPREQLAAIITSADNERFAEVLVNRLWQRVMGWGLATPVGDWYERKNHHGQLLSYLARQFVTSGYDYKQAARLIFNSRAYQRIAVDGTSGESSLAYASPWIRRMTAEQVVDSLHAATGWPLGTEEITFDPQAQQRYEAFLNLGVAKRAWQLTSLSNERDRPSLSLPKAATVVECLEAFGWRGARQEPVSHRETDANMVQPGVIANSAMAVRLSRLAEGSIFTQLALDAESPEAFVDQAFEQVLTRGPTAEEKKIFVDQISPGFESRIKTLAVPTAKPQPNRGFVTWANHFDIRANQLMREIEKEVAAGPPPSSRLVENWRERAEDALWALLNTPEYQFVP